MTNLIDTIAALPEVSSTNEWKDRTYINLEASKGSRAKADRTTKMWVKGDTLTIETGKGYNSDEFIAAKYALIEAVEAAGGTVCKR